MQHPLVDRSAAALELRADFVLDEQKLTDKDSFDDSAHSVEGHSAQHIEKDEYLESTLALVDVELVLSDQIPVKVEAMLGELYLDELDYPVDEEQDDGGEVDVVYEAHAAEADVQQVLPMVVLQEFGQVLFGKLGGF